MTFFIDQDHYQRSRLVVLTIVLFAVLEHSFFAGLFPLGLTPPLTLILITAFAKTWSNERTAGIIFTVGFLEDVFTSGAIGLGVVNAIVISIMFIALRSARILPSHPILVYVVALSAVVLEIVISGVWFGSFDLADIVGQTLIQSVALGLGVLLLWPIVVLLRERRVYEGLS